MFRLVFIVAVLAVVVYLVGSKVNESSARQVARVTKHHVKATVRVGEAFARELTEGDGGAK